MTLRNLVLFATAALVCLRTAAVAQKADEPRRAVTDPGVVTTRQAITPAGVPMVFEGRVYGVAFGRNDADLWIITAGSVFGANWRENQIFSRYKLEGSPGFSGIGFDMGRNRALVAARFSGRGGASVQAVAIGADSTVKVWEPKLGAVPAGAPSLSADGSTLVIPLVSENRAAVLDAASEALRGYVLTGIAPVGAAVSRDGSAAWVSNWGGRTAIASDKTAPTGYAPTADRVVVDEHGIAATGSVTRLDLRSMKPSQQIAVGLHPTSLALDEFHERLFVANNNSDSVSVIDTRANRVIRTIPLEPFGHAVRGIAPTSLALTSDGKRLFVACGGIDAVAVVDSATGAIESFIPTGWYPSSLAVSPDGKQLAIGALLGVGSGWRDAPGKRFVHSYRGSVAVVAMPDTAQLAGYTTAVAENNHLPMTLRPPESRRQRVRLRRRPCRNAPATLPASITSSSSSRKTGPTIRSLAMRAKATATPR